MNGRVLHFRVGLGVISLGSDVRPEESQEENPISGEYPHCCVLSGRTPKLSRSAKFAYANLVTSAGVPCWAAFTESSASDWTSTTTPRYRLSQAQQRRASPSS